MDSKTISFPEYVNTLSFERILSDSLPVSRSRAVSKVRFDFGKVQWCELFELALTVVWIDDIVRRKKLVEFVYPICAPLTGESEGRRSKYLTKRRNVCSYLNRWDFDDFLRSRQVTIIGQEQDYPYWTSTPEQTSILPLKLLHTYETFEEFLTQIEDKKQFEILFRDAMALSVIGNGGIRDTIIKEIGQNIYDHGSGRCAFLTIGTLPQAEDELHRKTRYEHAVGLEKAFFRTLERSGYLQIVIADGGPGIAHTLKASFQDDRSLREKDRLRSLESQIIAYAFEFNTTSKPHNVLKFKDEDDPGRGLYWVRELVLKNRGFLSIRSGSSIVAFDFLNNQTKHSYTTNANDRPLQRLAKLGGTQIKIYFPLNPELTSRPIGHSSVPVKSGVTDEAEYSTYTILELHRYCNEEGKWDKEHSVERFLADFPTKSSQLRGLNVSVVDFASTTWGKDELFPLLVTLAKLQHDGTVVVGINTEHIPEIFDIASDVLSEKIKQNPIKLRPILFIRDLTYEILGLSSEDKNLIQTLFSNKFSSEEPGPNCEDLANRMDNLLKVDSPHQLTLKIDIKVIRAKLSEHYKRLLNAVIFDEENGIYHSGKFVLPTNTYVGGYFRTNALLAHADSYRKVLFIFLNSLMLLEEPPNTIITFSSGIHELGEDLAKRLRAIYDQPIEHLNLKDARDIDHNAGIFLTKLKSKRVVVLNSVIGTAVSLESILTLCTDTAFGIRLQKILSIIDARDDDRAKRFGQHINHNTYEYRGGCWELESVIVSARNFFDSKPANWRSEDIQRIDPKTNAPDPVIPQPATEPLWKPADEFFLMNVVRNAKAMQIGHYTRRNRHYIYFFDMLRIGLSVSPEIAAKIEKDIADFSPTVQISHVIYDEQSRGAPVVAGEIALRFRRAACISIQDFIKGRKFIGDSIDGTDVIVYVNSVATGSKLQRVFCKCWVWKTSGGDSLSLLL